MTEPAATEPAASVDQPVGSSETAIGKTTDWAAAVKRIRDTNDWIIKAFIALGALLVGTSPLLAHLRGIEFNDQGIIGAIGILVSLASAGAIAWLASNVNLTELTTIVQLAAPENVIGDDVKKMALSDLKTTVESDETARWLYLGGNGSVSALIAARRDDVGALQSQTIALSSLPGTVSGGAGLPAQANPDVVELERLIKQTRANLASYDRLMTGLADWGSYETIKRRFLRNRRIMVVLGLTTFIGVCTWVLALGADLSDSKREEGASAVAAAETPALGVFTWANERAADDLRTRLTGDGKSMASSPCSSIGVIVEGGSGSAESPWQVSTLPRDPCPVHARFRAAGGVGVRVGSDHVAQTKAISTELKA
jgi:hypothetical protein